MIFSLLNGIFIFGLFIEMIERRFPQEFDRFMIIISFNCIYFYSKLQICLFQLNNKLNKIIEGNNTLLKIKNDLDSLISPKRDHLDITEFIKDGKSIIISETSIEKYDFLIRSFISDDKNTVIKKISFKIEEPNFIFNHSDIRFILMEIKTRENKLYKVDLKTDTYVYYLVGNIFTKPFFVYYLINYLNIDESIIDDPILSLKIIDHNVDTHEIIFTDKNQGILLEKNDYKVVSSNE